jgi:hypothetical protein
MSLTPGDSVVVTRGGLKTLMGTVVSVNPATGKFEMKVCAAQAQQINLTGNLEMNINEVSKRFEVRRRPSESHVLCRRALNDTDRATICCTDPLLSTVASVSPVTT